MFVTGVVSLMNFVFLCCMFSCRFACSLSCTAHWTPLHRECIHLHYDYYLRCCRLQKKYGVWGEERVQHRIWKWVSTWDRHENLIFFPSRSIHQVYWLPLLSHLEHLGRFQAMYRRENDIHVSKRKRYMRDVQREQCIVGYHQRFNVIIC